jgi:hypothetical protein
MEQAEMAITGQWHGKHAPVVMDTMIAELLDVVLPMRPVLRLDDEIQLIVS